MLPDVDLLKCAFACKCPRCRDGSLYKKGLSIELRDVCAVCGLDFSKNDSADGPAVFLIFVLGALLVPLALFMDFVFSPPLWFHGIFWAIVTLVLTVGALKPLKAYIIALQYKHRPGDWE